jgi:putative membrane protein
MKKKVLILAITILSTTLNAQSNRDKDFAKEAAEGGLLEVKLGELAKSRGTSETVRELGSQMVIDHTKANNELKTLVASKNISVPATLSSKGQKCYDKLAKKEGKSFDKAYTHSMVKDHKKNVCKFKKEAKKGDDAELKSWAANTLPTLEHHKEMSKDACKAVKKS